MNVVGKELEGVGQQFFELCKRIVEEEHLVLYDMEYHQGRGEVVVFIEDATTKTAIIEDCVRVDKALSPHLETEAWVPEQLTLQVSSPGLYRSLKSREHFEAVVGEEIKISLGALDRESELIQQLKGQYKIVAKLLSVLETGVEINYNGQTIFIDFESIKKANLETSV